MRQPRFLRHLVEKFLQKGQEANANLYPGILPIWETQPIGVTRLPISVMRIDSYVSNTPIDVSGDLDVPTVWTQAEDVAANETVNVFTGIAANVIIQFDSLVTNDLLPATENFFALRVREAGGGAVIFSQEGQFGESFTGPIHLTSPFMIFPRAVEIAATVANIGPAFQQIHFNTTLCLFPNRE